MQIYWGRHGDTTVPTTRSSGSFDTPLSASGRRQVRTAAQKLLDRNIAPTLIVSSQLPRAAESANIIGETVGYAGDIEPHEQLNEQDWAGDRSESAEALDQRAAEVAAWLRSLARTHTVLAVAHGRIGLAVVRQFSGRTFTSMAHAQIVRLRPQPIKWL